MVPQPAPSATKPAQRGPRVVPALHDMLNSAKACAYALLDDPYIAVSSSAFWSTTYVISAVCGSIVRAKQAPINPRRTLRSAF